MDSQQKFFQTLDTANRLTDVLGRIELDGGVSRDHVVALESIIPGVVMDNYPSGGFTTNPSEQNASVVMEGINSWMVRNGIPVQTVATENWAMVGKVLAGVSIFAALLALIRWIIRFITGKGGDDGAGGGGNVSSVEIKQLRKDIEKADREYDAKMAEIAKKDKEFRENLTKEFEEKKKQALKETADRKAKELEMIKEAKERQEKIDAVKAGKIIALMGTHGLSPAQVTSVVGEKYDGLEDLIGRITDMDSRRYKCALINAVWARSKYQFFTDEANMKKVLSYMDGLVDMARKAEELLTSMTDTFKYCNEVTLAIQDVNVIIDHEAVSVKSKALWTAGTPAINVCTSAVSVSGYTVGSGSDANVLSGLITEHKQAVQAVLNYKREKTDDSGNMLGNPFMVLEKVLSYSEEYLKESEKAMPLAVIKKMEDAIAVLDKTPLFPLGTYLAQLKEKDPLDKRLQAATLAHIAIKSNLTRVTIYKILLSNILQLWMTFKPVVSSIASDSKKFLDDIGTMSKVMSVTIEDLTKG